MERARAISLNNSRILNSEVSIDMYENKTDKNNKDKDKRASNFLNPTSNQNIDLPNSARLPKIHGLTRASASEFTKEIKIESQSSTSKWKKLLFDNYSSILNGKAIGDEVQEALHRKNSVRRDVKKSINTLNALNIHIFHKIKKI